MEEETGLRVDPAAGDWAGEENEFKVVPVHIIQSIQSIQYYTLIYLTYKIRLHYTDYWYCINNLHVFIYHIYIHIHIHILITHTY